MAVITQNYDVDLKATGEYPVVKMSQFDTGSRTIVFTVYDGRELAAIDGMVARVDGTRSDGVEFSSTCTVGTSSKVSFTISQEMTKYAGKHTAELVIFDASGNPAGTQNFVIDVEPSTMVRDSAASADDRTLYDQFTDSVSKAVADKIAQMDSKYTEFTNSMAGLKGRWGSHVPFFGDSITAGYLSGGVTFRDVLSSTFGFEGHNYAAGGEGFYRAGQSGGDIAHEVANSKSDDSYDHSRVRLAVVCGGVNDVDRDVTKGRDGVRRVMEAIRGEYPNATILLASGLGGAFNPTYGRLDHRNVGYYDAIVSEGMARGAMIAHDAFTWVGTDGTLLADGLHPNTSGHRVIGAHLSNILAGFADPTSVTDASGQITKTADQDTLDARLHVAGRSVRLYLHLGHILTDADFDESLGGVRFVMCRTPNWLKLTGYLTGAVIGFGGEYNTLNQHYWSIGNGSASMVIRQVSGARQMKTGMKLDISISVDTVLA